MTSKQPPRRLGRGLSSLISADLTHAAPLPGPVGIPPEPEVDVPPQQAPSTGANIEKPPLRVLVLRIDDIRTNPLQPRKTFDDSKLAELAASIKARGTIQPIVVRPADGGYELIAGERRLRASKLAGLAEITAIVRQTPDDQLLELALIENIQRAELNPVERARAYRVLAEKYKLTHEQVAERVGEDRATVSNYLRILSLGSSALAHLEAGEISTGHAKVLLGILDPLDRERLAGRIVAEGWSVRRLETELARSSKASVRTESREAKRPAVTDWEERLRSAVGGRVSIREGRKHSGKIIIEYYSLDDFERIARSLGVDVESV